MLSSKWGAGKFKCRVIYDYWDVFHKEHPQFRLSIEDVGKGLVYLDRMNLFESIRWSAPLDEEMDFLELSTTPVCLAVPRGHRYYGRETIRLDDLKGETVTTITRGLWENLDCLADEMVQAGAVIDTINMYDHSAFSRCVMNKFLLQVPQCWSDIIPDMKTIPCEWSYTLPYGFSYSSDPQSPAHVFAQFVKKHLQT